MERKTFQSRLDYKKHLHEYGFDYDTIDSIDYWKENVGYKFSSDEISQVESATQELSEMALKAVQFVIDNNRFNDLGIPSKWVPLIKRSWERDDFTLYGRFDLCAKDGKVKAYEYNADTPTSLLEASLVQFYWKQDNNLNDQFNFIHEQLIEQWQYLKNRDNPNTIYFSCARNNLEDFRNTEYIMDTASQAGINVKFIFINDIGSDGEHLYDLDNNKMHWLFKLYPWEWLINEEFADVLLKDTCRLIEPAWKMLLSNKGIMAILSEMYPDHPLLLKTTLKYDVSMVGHVCKPILSREGANVDIYDNSGQLIDSKDGEYGEEGCIYQEAFTLPEIDGMHPVIGSWVVGDVACGMGIREDKSLITGNTSFFVPHYFD